MEFGFNCYLVWACALMSVACMRVGVALLTYSQNPDWIISAWVITKMAFPFLFLVNERWLANKLLRKLEAFEAQRDANI